MRNHSHFPKAQTCDIWAHRWKKGRPSKKKSNFRWDCYWIIIRIWQVSKMYFHWNESGYVVCTHVFGTMVSELFLETRDWDKAEKTWLYCYRFDRPTNHFVFVQEFPKIFGLHFPFCFVTKLVSVTNYCYRVANLYYPICKMGNKSIKLAKETFVT